ncbi:type 2 periplasmic-binding domain-containing protein [Flindersiella endophytica]
MTDDRKRTGLDRRAFLRRAAYLSAAVSSPGLLAACATGGGGDTTNDKPKSSGKKTAQNPLGVDASAPLDVVIFKGGWSDEYAKYHEGMYKKRYPSSKVSHLGTREIAGQLQTRFANGTPPDFIDNSGAQMMDLATLVTQGQVQDISEVLKAASWDDPKKTVEQTLIEGALDPLKFEGKPYGLPYVLNISGLWHNKKTFEANGWETPKTWDDLMALGEKTKAKGLPLLTYQGQYPGYMMTVFHSLVNKRDGNVAMKAIDNLEDGAWSQDAVREVAEAFEELKAKKYIMPGTAALDHTQAQAAWLQGKAALIPCGSWLKKEMESQVPSDFEFVIHPTPSMDASDKIPYEATPYGPGENYIVPSKAKNVPGGLEMIRIMCSKEGAQKFAELCFALTVVEGAHDDQTFDPVLTSSLETLKAAQKVQILDSVKYSQWYVEMKDEVNNACGQLLTGKLDAKGFLARCQKKADEIKKNPSIKKFTR